MPLSGTVARKGSHGRMPSTVFIYWMNGTLVMAPIKKPDQKLAVIAAAKWQEGLLLLGTKDTMWAASMVVTGGVAKATV